MTERRNTISDFWVKAFSLALAVLIWKTVDHAIHLKTAAETSSAAKAERIIRALPISVMRDGADIHSFRLTPARVDVTLSAPALQNIRDKDIEVYVNLKDVLDGVAMHKRVQVFAPPEVTVIRVSPPEVSVDVIHFPETSSNTNK
jgi:YbbR domain-containing protein